MKYVKLIVALLIIGVVLIAIYGGSCRGTVKTGLRGIYDQFRSHYENGDFDAMASMLTESSRKRIEALGEGSFQAGFEKKLAKEEILKKALTLDSGDETDRTLSGKMIHQPYAFEKAVRNASKTAIKAENLTKQLKSASAEKKAELESEISVLTATYQSELQAALDKEGEKTAKDAVHAAMSSNNTADAATLRNAVIEALESSEVAKLQNGGFIRFAIGAGGNYKWDVVKIPNTDDWMISIP